MIRFIASLAAAFVGTWLFFFVAGTLFVVADYGFAVACLSASFSPSRNLSFFGPIAFYAAVFFGARQIHRRWRFAVLVKRCETCGLRYSVLRKECPRCDTELARIVPRKEKVSSALVASSRGRQVWEVLGPSYNADGLTLHDDGAVSIGSMKFDSSCALDIEVAEGVRVKRLPGLASPLSISHPSGKAEVVFRFMGGAWHQQCLIGKETR